jgi:hypothetical protein
MIGQSDAAERSDRALDPLAFPISSLRTSLTRPNRVQYVGAAERGEGPRAHSGMGRHLSS